MPLVVWAQSTSGLFTLIKDRLVEQRKDAVEENIYYDESIYIVSNYSGLSSQEPESGSISELLDKEVEGFYFFIKWDENKREILLRNPDGSFAPFSKTLDFIQEALSKDSLKIITLFLDFHVSIINVEPAFENAGLNSYLLEYDFSNGWPSLKNMIEENKRLVVFEMKKDIYSPSWIHYLPDFSTNLLGENYRNAESFSFDDNLMKSLSVFNGYKTRNFSVDNDRNLNFARHNPYLIEQFKDSWLRTGKVPNYMFVDKYYDWMSNILLTVRNFYLVFGLVVNNNNELINYVNWEGLSNYTGGKFCFPLEQGASLSLSPSIPGYHVAPVNATAFGKEKKIYLKAFKASPLKIEDELAVYLPLNRNADNAITKKEYPAKSVEFIFDLVRGPVASFGEHSRIELCTANEVNVKDHDFTAMAWIKIPRYLDDKQDYCILGAKGNGYLQALHLMIRSGKPYFGFFNNDLEGKTFIAPGRWYHLVWRYNKNNGEQAIFVDGKLDAISFNRPAYLGHDSLYIGFAEFNQNSHFIGSLTNFSIWSRALSDKEILGLSNQILEINPPARENGWNFRNIIGWVLVLSSLLIVILFVLFYLKRKPKPRKKKLQQNVILPDYKPVFLLETQSAIQTNYIRLFGDFCVLDKEGVDITSLFTPKLKQLFILLLLSSLEDKTGISSGNLTKIIWGEDSLKTTKSLRSVSILKLRKILDRIEGVQLLFNANKYSVSFSENVYCDYLVCYHLFKEKQLRNKEEFEKLYQIVRQGEIFKGEAWSWLDDFKGYICNNIVDVALKFIREYSIHEEVEMVIGLAEQILLNDPSNEEALEYKIKALMIQDNSKSAKYTYERFCSLYYQMYGEPFKPSFEELAS